ncbi:tryptophan halogenase family protein [Maricaulis sp. D1M11]|uniref:tryptophan halogenase family protein n=1 Tax=Maricaulis sp. D1M11 TaxID=3076117 RepID=UPI0039B6BAA8
MTHARRPDTLSRILIVGGGTAGWMSAALLARSLHGSGCRIELVEAPDIPTIGVGEATIPPIRQFNQLIGLDDRRLFAEASASFKLGIEFVDWLEPGQRYFHPFGVYGANLNTRYTHHKWARLAATGRLDADLSDFSLCSKAALSGRCGLPHPDPTQCQSTLTSAYHFDAGLYAKLLRDHAQGLGVVRIEGRVETVNLDAQTGFIQSVRLANGRQIAADFYVDCSGQRSLLLGEALGVPFVDFKHWLPCDRAVAAPAKRSGPRLPYTRSTARSAGWQWRIPLQHRLGQGYVHASDFIDEAAAEAEFIEGLDGELIAEPRFIPFRTGRRAVMWDKNCLAVGLSSGFLEPLESTSIHLIQTALTRLLDHFPDRRCEVANTRAYNDLAVAEFDSIRDFLILHYKATRRRDTAFWRHVADMDIPDALAERIALFEETGRVPLRTVDLFTETSWVAVFIGQGIVPVTWDPLVDNMSLDALAAEMTDQKTRIDQTVYALPRHDQLIQAMSGAPVSETA